MGAHFPGSSLASLSIIYSSSTGHTEYVVDTLVGFLGRRSPKLLLERQRAEVARPEDFLRPDVLLLACGTWNTGGMEGQLHPHMHLLLRERMKDLDLKRKPCSFVALGDDRYYYTARATEYLMQFIVQHGGNLCVDPLIIINEPYGQEERMEKWGEKLLAKMPATRP
jgi:flavodoxin I